MRGRRRRLLCPGRQGWVGGDKSLGGNRGSPLILIFYILFCPPDFIMPSSQLSQAGDLIMEVYIEQQLPDNCVTLKVSPEGTGGEMRGLGGGLGQWTDWHGSSALALTPGVSNTDC